MTARDAVAVNAPTGRNASMLLMMLTGWLLGLPAVVIGGLYVTNRHRDDVAPQSLDLDAIAAFAVRAERPRERAPLAGAGARSAGY
jgi:hypothetical protein